MEGATRGDLFGKGLGVCGCAEVGGDAGDKGARCGIDFMNGVIDAGLG